jgi:Uma2 family endonuclease
MTSTELLTASDFQRRAAEFDRVELIRGVLYPMSPTSGSHGAIASRIHGALYAFVSSRGLGELFVADSGFVVASDPDSVLAPDVAFVATARVTAALDGVVVPFAPDLAVEIESPSNRVGELLTKAALYLEGGSTQVWLVRPQHRAVTVFRRGLPDIVLTDRDMLEGGDLLPGFSFSVSALFGGIEPTSTR